MESFIRKTKQFIRATNPFTNVDFSITRRTHKKRT